MSLAKIKDARFGFGALLLIIILTGEIIFEELKLPAWPAFMVMVLFFMENGEMKKTGHILAGGLFGILCYVFLTYFKQALLPVMPVEISRILFILIFVYAIVSLGGVLPAILNNFSFIFFLVSGLAGKTPDAGPLTWAAVELIGGGIFILCVKGIDMLTIRLSRSADK